MQLLRTIIIQICRRAIFIYIFYFLLFYKLAFFYRIVRTHVHKTQREHCVYRAIRILCNKNNEKTLKMYVVPTIFVKL